MKSLIIFYIFACLFLSINNDKLEFLTDERVISRACLGYDHQRDKFTVFPYSDELPFDKEFVACGTYKSSLETTGWDNLSITSYQGDLELYRDADKAKAMGYLEAYFTKDRIWNHYNNMKNYHFSDNKYEMFEVQKEFLQKNFKWMKDQAEAKHHTVVYWKHVHLILKQLEGLVVGYNHFQKGNDKKINLIDFQVMNTNGDLTEIKYYKKEHRPDFGKMTLEQLMDYHEKNTHCSALIKVAEDLSDIFFAHNTWTNFSSMTRIIKEYKFKSNNNEEKSKSVVFSSYPGCLTSIDDFYITDSDLYVTETTNHVYNEEIFDILTPESLLPWVRVMIANRLVDNGKDWYEVFRQYNSGTYNNQFQILDMKLINYENDKVKINDGALWVMEQIPGLVHGEDLTNHLRQTGYWASYNAPYFKDIRDKSGIDKIIAEKPEMVDSIDHDKCIRAQIFNRDHKNVKDIDSLKTLMRYNNYKIDELSKNNPGFAIACRRDLDQKDPQCRGATDVKIGSVRNSKGLKEKKIFIVSGPTTDIQIPFDTQNARCITNPNNPPNESIFVGLPKTLDYPWTEYKTTIFDE